MSWSWKLGKMRIVIYAFKTLTQNVWRNVLKLWRFQQYIVHGTIINNSWTLKYDLYDIQYVMAWVTITLLPLWK